MGVKSYVAGLQAEAVDSVTNALADGLSYAKRVKEAKDKTDINRESIAVQGKVENFIKDLEYDRDWQKYPEKLDEQFANLESYIDDNDLLSGAAKKQLKEDILPQYKTSAQNSITSMQTRSQMAEINVELEGFRSILSSDTETSMNDALARYRDHLTDLGIYNKVTVSKMSDDFRYSLAPSKAVQDLMADYKATYSQGDTGYKNKMESLAQEYELDGNQKALFIQTAAAQKKAFDQNVDGMYEGEIENLQSQVSEAYASGRLFDAGSIDAMIENAPPRWKVRLTAEKTKIFNNNDSVSEDYLESKMLTGGYLGVEDMAVIQGIKDPTKRSKMTSKAITHNIDANIALSTGNTSLPAEEYDSQIGTHGTDTVQSAESTEPAPEEQMKAIDNTEIPATEKEKTRAKAWVISDSLTQGISFEDLNRAIIAGFPQREEAPVEPVSTVEPQVEASQPAEPPAEIAPVAEPQTEATPVADAVVEPDTNTPAPVATEDVETIYNTNPKKDPGYNGSGIYNTSKLEGSALATALILNARNGYNVPDSEYSRLPASQQALIDEMILKGKDIASINSPTLLKYLQTVRMEPNISQENYRKQLMDAVSAGAITMETADKMSRPSYVDNENFKYISELVTQTLSDNKDLISDPLDFRYDLNEMINRELLSNKDLIGKDFGSFRNMMNIAVSDIIAGGILSRLTGLTSDVTKNGDRKLENLRAKDFDTLDSKAVQSFIADVYNGEYELYIRKDLITKPAPGVNMKEFRNSSKENILNQVSQTVKGVSWEDLQKTGSRIDMLEVASTADFLAVGAQLEKAMYGSFGIKPSDMIMIGNQWAFSDPETKTMYFIPEFTDSVSKDGIGWTMAYVKDGKIVNRVAIDDYVDPALRFEHKEMREYMESRAYRVKEEKQESTPLAARARDYGTVNHDFTQADQEKMAELDADLKEAKTNVVKARNTLLFQGVNKEISWQ